MEILLSSCLPEFSMPVIQGGGKGNTVLTWRGAPGKVTA